VSDGLGVKATVLTLGPWLLHVHPVERERSVSLDVRCVGGELMNRVR